MAMFYKSLATFIISLFAVTLVDAKAEMFKKGDSVAVTKDGSVHVYLFQLGRGFGPFGLCISDSALDYKQRDDTIKKSVEVVFVSKFNGEQQSEMVAIENICSPAHYRIMLAREDSAKAIRDSISRWRDSKLKVFSPGDTAIVTDGRLSIEMGNPPSNPPTGIVLAPGTFMENGKKMVKVRFETMSGNHMDRVIEQDKLEQLFFYRELQTMYKKRPIYPYDRPIEPAH